MGDGNYGMCAGCEYRRFTVNEIPYCGRPDWSDLSPCFDHLSARIDAWER